MATEFSLNAVRFEDVRTGIVNYLKENGAYKAEFDFNGSNIAYFIDSAAYLTMLISYQNTITSNNIFLDTTEIRKNAVSIVKRMGYRPKRKISSQFTGVMEYFAAQDETFVSGDSVIIPSRTIFTSSPSSLQFQNLLPITLTYETDVLLSGPFILVEGEFKTVQTFGTGKDLQEIVIDSEDVEEANMSVFVRTNNTATATNIEWTEVPSFFSSSEDTIYFVEEDIVNEKRPKILFGDGVLGRVPLNTETITIEYLQTKGDEANKETGVDFFDVNGPSHTETHGDFSNFDYDFTNLTINTTNLEDSSGGKDNGTLVEIQFNAPRFFSTAGRGVTKDDFLFQLSEFDSTLKYSNVIGGNVLFPDDSNELGVIYICGVPTGIDQDDFINESKIYLTELEENVIIPQIEDTTVIATSKRFIKPTYIYLQLDPFIEVPESFSAAETQTAIAAVESDLDTFIVDNLRGLQKPFRHSKALSSITSSIGIISAELDTTHNAIINQNSFYSGRTSIMNFPVIFDRDSGGVIILDENNVPTTSNFVKKRSEIITEANDLRIAGARESSIFTVLPNTDGQLQGKYFTISDFTVLDTEVQYYLWMTSGSGSGDIDPAPAGISNGIEVNIQSGDPASEVAIAITAALNSINDTNAFVASSSGGDITVTNKNEGFLLNNAADGDAGFVFVLLTRGLNTNYFDQFSLPIEQSSLFGSLTHSNSDRKIFNIDVSSIEFIKFQLLGASGSEVLSYETFPFKDQNDVVYTPNLVETTTSTWNVQLNGRNIAILNKISVTSFTLTGVDDFYLSGTVGIVPADGEANLLNVESITETDENGAVTSFFSMNALLNNEAFTDIRLYGKTKIADAIFDAKTFTWAYTNTPIFETELSPPGADVTFAAQDATDIDESFLEVDHGDGKEIVLSMKNFNGLLTLNNFNEDDLVQYDFRNDFELTTNFTTAQEPSKVTYQISKQFTADADNVQQINLRAAEVTEITTQSNNSDILDGTFFYLNSALDETNYYVYFSSPTSASNDPTPIGTFTGIEVDLEPGTIDADVVALALIDVLNNSAVTDFSAALNSPEIDEVNITNNTNGRSVNASLPTIVLSAAYAYDASLLQFTDETVIANNANASPGMNLLPSTGAALDDAYYFAKDHKFTNLTLNIGTPGIGTWVVEYQYYDGAAWSNLYAVDDTEASGLGAFTTTGHNEISWDMPIDWASNNLDIVSGGPTSGPYYWVRALVTTADISGVTQPLGTQGFVSGLPRPSTKTADPNNDDVFLLAVTTQGADNLSTDFDKFQADDLVTITGSDTVNDDGTFLIKSIDSVTGLLEIYNVSGVLDITGTATLTHFEIETGTYGTFTIDGFDIYHDISIGKMKYLTGVLTFEQNIKGFTDLANSKITIKSIRSIFNNYTTTDRMDTIKIIPIDRFSNAGIFLGQQNDFDTGFNQSIETIVSTPTIKT